MAFQLGLIWWLLFGNSIGVTAFAVAMIVGMWLMLVCATRVFERVTATVDRSLTGILRLVFLGVALLSLRVGGAAYGYDSAKEVERHLKLAQSLSKWTRRRFVWVRSQLDSARIHRWAAFITLADACRWLTGLLFGSILFWAGLLGIVAEGCSATLTTLVQVAASAFLPGDVSGAACASGWRLLCAASFWLILSLLVAPAVGKMGERQDRMTDMLFELRTTIRMFVTRMRTSEKQGEGLIRKFEERRTGN